MAVRRGRRESFFSPAKVSFDSRGRVDDVDAREQALDQRLHGRGADQQRLLPAADG